MGYGKVPNTTAGTSSTSVSYHRSEVLDDEGYVHRGSRLTQLERHRFCQRFAKGGGFFATKTLWKVLANDISSSNVCFS